MRACVCVRPVAGGGVRGVRTNPLLNYWLLFFFNKKQPYIPSRTAYDIASMHAMCTATVLGTGYELVKGHQSSL